MNRLKKKSNFQVVPFQKQKKTLFQYELKIIQELKSSSAGNPTPVSNVTGWDTHCFTSLYSSEHICQAPVIWNSQVTEWHNRTRSAFRNPDVYSNMKSQHFWFKKITFSHPNIVPAKKNAQQKIILVEYLKKASFESTQKEQFSCSSISKTKKTSFRYELKIIQELKTSSAGNPTPVSNVTGWDTHRFTTLYSSEHICQARVIWISQVTEWHNRTRSAFRNPAVYSNMNSDFFFEKSSFFSSQHRPSKKLGAESHGCKLSETKVKALNRLKKKSKPHVVPVQKNKSFFDTN